MTVKTEEAEVKTVDDEKKGNLLDNDTLRKLHRNELDFDSLSEEQRIEFHARFVEGEEEGVPTEEEEAAAIAKAQNPEEGKTPSELPKFEGNKEEKNLDPDKQKWLQERKTMLGDNNTLTQKLASAQKKLENLQNMRVPEAPAVDPAIQDDDTKKQTAWNSTVANKLNTYVEAQSQELKTETDKLRTQAVYQEANILQFDNPELKTSVPVNALDKSFINFRNNISQPNATEAEKSKNVENFLQNEETRKAHEANGYLFPFNEGDWTQYKTISKIRSFKQNGGDPNWDSSRGDMFPDLDTAYYAYRRKTGYVPDTVKNAVLDTANKVLDKIGEQHNHSTVLSPTDGVHSDTTGGMTEAQAEAWLLDNPTADTPEKMATLKAIMKRFGPQQHG